MATEYEVAQQEVLRLHEGAAIRDAAEAIVSEMPDDALTFIGTSTEGAALAAVCAAVHGAASDWHQVNLMGPLREVAHPPVIVEPVDGGAGWRNAVMRRYPDARIEVAVKQMPRLFAAR